MLHNFGNGSKPLRPPVYVNQVSADGTKVARVKRSAEHGESLFKQVEENKRKIIEMKQKVVQPVKFSVVGNYRASSGNSVDQELSSGARAAEHQNARLYLGSTVNPAHSSDGLDSEVDENNGSMNLAVLSVDKTARQSASKPDDAVARATDSEKRKPQNRPAQVGSAGLPSLLTMLDSGRSESDDSPRYIDIFLPRAQIPVATRTSNPLDNIQTGGRRISMVERVTLEGEIARLKSMVMPDFARDLFLGKFALPKDHFSVKAPTEMQLQRVNKQLEERDRMARQSDESAAQNAARRIMRAQSDMFLQEPNERNCGDQLTSSVSNLLQSMRTGLSKRELSLLKHHLLPPLARERTLLQSGLSSNTLSVRNFSSKSTESSVALNRASPRSALRSLDTAPHSAAAQAQKSDEPLTLTVGNADEQHKATVRKGVKPSNVPLWATGSRRRFSRPFAADTIIVRRFSKGVLRPPRQAIAARTSTESGNGETMPVERSGSFPPQHVPPLTEELTAINLQITAPQLSNEQTNAEETSNVLLSHRSTVAVPNSVSRASFSPPAETNTDAVLSQRSRTQVKAAAESRTSRVCFLLRNMLRQLKTYYAQPHGERTLIVPRSELVSRFRKLDSDADGHLTFAQLESSLPEKTSLGQRVFIRAVYDLTVQSSSFGFDEFSGVHVICYGLEAVKSELAKRAFEQLEGFLVEEAIEFFLTLYEGVLSSQDSAGDMHKIAKKDGVQVDRLLDALSSDETLQQSSEYLSTVNRPITESSVSPIHVKESQLQRLRSVFLMEHIGTCSQLQFLVFIPLFLAIFKPDKFRKKTLAHSLMM